MKHIIQNLLRLIRHRSGNAMLEFALGAGILTTVFTGTFQFGYTFYQYNNLTNAVNNGARYASVLLYDGSTSTPPSSYLNAVRNVVVYGDPAGGSVPVVPGLATSNVNVAMTFTNGVPTGVTVSISNFTLAAIVGQTTLNTKPQFTYPYIGIYAPA